MHKPQERGARPDARPNIRRKTMSSGVMQRICGCALQRRGRCAALLAAFWAGSIAMADPCVVTGDGGGTVSLPPAGCAYLSPDDVHMIIDGLPPGTEVELGAIHIDFICRESGNPNPNHCGTPGGPLGGETEQFNSGLQLHLHGKGGLAGFDRAVTIPNVLSMTATGPRTPGQPVQSFPTNMLQIQGQLPPGDPDFDLLRVTAGNSFGMPSPGHTTLTALGGGQWAVDSFFDITYRIDFIGAPGGPLAGHSGSTTATIRMRAQDAPGADCIPEGQDCWSTPCGSTRYGFGATPIPADFFGPGSEPFTGLVVLGGASNGSDTIMRRLMPMCFNPTLPSTATTPIELVQLNLTSCEPITVTYSDGRPDQLWNVAVSLSPTAATLGSLTATKTHPNGGTYDTSFFVRPVFTFTRGTQVRTLSPPTEFEMTSSGQPWSHSSPVPQCSPGFAPGVDSTLGCCVEQCHAGPSPDHQHCTLPPGCPECPPPVCAPLPSGQGCQSGGCGTGECQAHCARYSPLTGASEIIACDCSGSTACHLVRQAAAGGPGLRANNPCEVSDNGSGTVTLPPAGCAYLSPDDVHMIIDGLPPGTTLQLAANHQGFFCGGSQGIATVCTPPLPPPSPVGVVCDEVPGGGQGGNRDCFESQLDLQIQGTGTLASYNRVLSLPLSTEIHTGPRTPGAPVQDFAADVFRQFGQITGDPDFDLLRITAGSDFGLPSPGHTTLTQLPGGNWAVDSFFDITYRIDFVGAAGGPFGGMSGSTTATIRMATGVPLSCTGVCPVGTTCHESRLVNADGTVDVCCNCVTVLPNCNPADVNCDGSVNGGDILAIRAPGTWNTATTARPDVNNDGQVNGGDILAVRAPGTWNTSTGPCTCTP
jgi:hypothetical protein